MNPVGVMQGRLVPRIGDRIQAFPWERWEEEFETAKACGFDSIEFIFEADRSDENPIYTSGGIKKVRGLIDKTGIPVSSICADYFMEHPFFRVPEEAKKESADVLISLISMSSQAGVRLIEIPCVDQSAIKTEEDKAELIKYVSSALPAAEKHGVAISLETSLPPLEFRELIERFNHPLMAVNFDIGNSASMGYEPGFEIKTLGPFIANIHIKDRILHGGTVPLGEGNADFPAVFKALKGISYKGPFILQTARDADDAGVAKKYLGMVRNYIKEYGL
ncbi:MAG: sugar phosphate isomerase/epimerase family protein [Thermodesulfovibrionales bacterium]|nr:sugar phosphate isomerase/epimerase family protein [Thermodesulfovibrionales bacterium]